MIIIGVIKDRVRGWRLHSAFFVALVFALSLLFLILNSTTSPQLVLSVDAKTRGPVQVFFDVGNGFNENDSETVIADQGSSDLGFYIPTGTVRSIRIDPSPSQSPFDITRPRLAGFKLQDDYLVFSNVTHANQASFFAKDNSLSIYFTEASTDPFVQIDLVEPIENDSRISILQSICFLAILFCSILLLSYSKLRHASQIPLLLGIAAGMLILVLSLVSPIKVEHPDEELHRADARYFQIHNLPPSLDSDDLLPSLLASPFGVSYLFEWNITYLVAGKVSAILSWFHIPENYSFRLLNVSFFFTVLLATYFLRGDPTYLIPLIVVPQAWYVFSYFNGDGLPLALSFIAAMLGTSKNGPIEGFLRGEKSSSLHIFIFIVVIGLLVISKKNYYIVILFILLWQSIRVLQVSWAVLVSSMVLVTSSMFLSAGGSHFVSAIPVSLQTLFAVCIFISACVILHFLYLIFLSKLSNFVVAKRFILIYSLALLIALPWISADVIQNGSPQDKENVVRNLIETFADPEFKPSSVFSGTIESHSGLRLADKGIGLTTIAFHPYNWFTISFKSFYAAFGYMEFFAVTPFYYLFTLLFFSFIGAGVCSRLGQDYQLSKLFFLSLTCGICAVGTSYLFSWTYGFQPQGRYVLAVLPMSAPLMTIHSDPSRLRALSNIGLIIAFCVAVFVFIKFGLFNFIT